MKIAMVAGLGGSQAMSSRDDCEGQAAYIAAVSAALARAGHQVEIYTRREELDSPDRVETSDGYTVVQVHAGPARRMPKHKLAAYMGKFAEFLHAEWAHRRPDVAHAHSWASGFATQLAAKHLDLAALHTFHSFGTESQRHHLETMVARSASAVAVTYTDAVAEVLHMGRRRSDISVLPHGVDVDLFVSHGPKSARDSRRRIVSLGKVLPHSGFDVVIKALTSMPDTDFVIVGGAVSDRQTKAEVRRLRALAQTLGVADRVVVSESVEQQDIPPLIRSADVVVCTPSHESFGTAALEAMACGVPVVAADVGGFRDTVVNEVTGFLVNPHRHNEVGLVLNRLMRDEFLRQSLGAAGRDRVCASYTWDRVAADSLRLYDRAASQGCRAAS
jgi:glycosyltransferase involved in cell wall biosynthesis